MCALLSPDIGTRRSSASDTDFLIGGRGLEHDIDQSHKMYGSDCILGSLRKGIKNLPNQKNCLQGTSRQIKTVPGARILLDVVPCSSSGISFEVLHQIEPNKVLEIYIQHSKQKKIILKLTKLSHGQSSTDYARPV